MVTGASDWPLRCADRFHRWPLAASSLAYLGPDEAPDAARLHRRLRTITSSSPAEGRAFASYLGVHRRVQIVGSPQTDDFPSRAAEPSLVLVVTSAPHPDGTGDAAPGTDLLLDACRLRAADKRILVGLHPREDRSSTITDPAEATTAITEAHIPDAATLADAVDRHRRLNHLPPKHLAQPLTSQTTTQAREPVHHPRTGQHLPNGRAWTAARGRWQSGDRIRRGGLAAKEPGNSRPSLPEASLIPNSR
ncbi:hypothetical protein [Actinomadura fibrosa]|uniref:Uncharacterized protein n=1 Tax=Actinomadura fibrosa TaxID=111802 RepID=A0ABW2Y0V9_9ACTN|nr:hypothetical protein [Actinomadura fibrosa]